LIEFSCLIGSWSKSRRGKGVRGADIGAGSDNDHRILSTGRLSSMLIYIALIKYGIPDG
jgi:hypothetical protein